MIYYKMQMMLNENAKSILEESAVSDLELLGTKINQSFEQMKYNKYSVIAYVTNIENDNIIVIFSKISEDVMERVQKEIKDKAEFLVSMSITIKSVKEITVEEFRRGISDSYSNGYVRNCRTITNELKIDYNDNCCFDVKEGMVSEEILSREEALKRAHELMGDEEYITEMERIYCEQNVKEFYCHPVHYHIIAGNEESANAMTDLLLKALNSNGRLLGRRVSYVLELKQSCYDEQDFYNLVCNSQGATIILSMNTEKNKSTDITNDYEEVVSYIGKLVSRYCKNVLFIFQEIVNKNSISKKLISEIEEKVHIIELSEGVGKKEQAEIMLKQLVKNSEYTNFLELDEEIAIPTQESYTLSEIYNFFDKWAQEIVYKKAYKSYGIKERLVIEKEAVDSSAYEELNQMIGLNEIKDLIEQIIAMNRIQKKRQEMGFHMQDSALHMLFTGNPGSAKTTVARLLTRILYEEGVIKNKNIVECGRSDLVGKYVGWTAKQVKNRFREAKGGVLFIDEAYSLVDDRNGSYGDEAINTIVQEMENHRTEVIVIFAGYPEKMERFLEKNEGLKSRIAFHLKFPDYTKDELVDMLALLIKQKGYNCEATVYDKCAHIFEKALLDKEFGNGRYVRNLLEHAIMKQSKRVMKEFVGIEIDKKQINCLIAEDFEEIELLVKTSKNTIGFQYVLESR